MEDNNLQKLIEEYKKIQKRYQDLKAKEDHKYSRIKTLKDELTSLNESALSAGKEVNKTYSLFMAGELAQKDIDKAKKTHAEIKIQVENITKILELAQEDCSDFRDAQSSLKSYERRLWKTISISLRKEVWLKIKHDLDLCLAACFFSGHSFDLNFLFRDIAKYGGIYSLRNDQIQPLKLELKKRFGIGDE
jgi:hypothetical protein